MTQDKLVVSFVITQDKFPLCLFERFRLVGQEAGSIVEWLDWFNWLDWLYWLGVSP